MWIWLAVMVLVPVGLALFSKCLDDYAALVENSDVD